jgi:hypothetical protein
MHLRTYNFEIYERALPYFTQRAFRVFKLVWDVDGPIVRSWNLRHVLVESALVVCCITMVAWIITDRVVNVPFLRCRINIDSCALYQLCQLQATNIQVYFRPNFEGSMNQTDVPPPPPEGPSENPGSSLGTGPPLAKAMKGNNGSKSAKKPPKRERNGPRIWTRPS